MTRALILRLASMLCLTAAAAWPARAQQPPEYVEAYVLLVKAEQAEQRGEMDEALRNYERALEQYRLTARRHPGWRSAQVEYRIVDCRNRIEQLRARAAARPPAPAGDAPDGRPDRLEELERLLRACEDERKQTLESVQQVEMQLAAARRRVDELERQAVATADTGTNALEAVIRERNELAEQVASFRETMTFHQADMENVAAMKTEIRRLEKQVRQLQRAAGNPP